MGSITLIANYFAYLISLNLAPLIGNYKRAFQIAAILYSSNYALYLLKFTNTLGLMLGVFGSLVSGFGAALIWVSQGGFMVKLFHVNQIDKNQ
jgi:hypothetical protein